MSRKDGSWTDKGTIRRDAVEVSGGLAGALAAGSAGAMAGSAAGTLICPMLGTALVGGVGFVAGACKGFTAARGAVSDKFDEHNRNK